MVYPNPANNSLNLAYVLNADGEVQIEIVDVLGKKVIQENSSGRAGEKTNKALGIEALSSGPYLLTIRQNGAIILSSKIIKNED